MKEFLKYSFPYYKKYLPAHIFATICGLFRVVILLITPQVVALLVDHVIVPLLGGEVRETSSIFYFLIAEIPAGEYWRIFWTLALALIGFAVAFFVCFYLKWNLAHYFALKSERKMRQDALNKVGSASAALLSKYPAGDLILITTSDPSRVRDLYTAIVQWMLDSFLYVSVASVLLATIHDSLLFLPLLGAAACVVIVARYQKPMRQFFDSVWSSSAELSTAVQESVYGIRTVASFAREDFRRSIFGIKNKNLLDVNYRGVKMFAKRNFLTECVRIVIFVGEAALAVWLALSGKITAGECTALMGYLSTLV